VAQSPLQIWHPTIPRPEQGSTEEFSFERQARGQDLSRKSQVGEYRQARSKRHHNVGAVAKELNSSFDMTIEELYGEQTETALKKLQKAI